ncbi:MAG: oligosaccharide flippase family protein [Hyphomicrobiaceae bacterium]
MKGANATGYGRRVAGQGLLLFCGHAMGQFCALARNALLGHLLSKGDFGIAVTLTLTLQVFEILSDVAADRMIVRAEDGDNPKLVDVGHLMLIARGLVIATLLWALAPLAASYFKVDGAEWAFRWVALIPLVKAFMHLDARRMQRSLVNRPIVLIETVPQVIALALTYFMVQWAGDYGVVVWLALLQAVMAVLISHVVAERGYRIGVDWAILSRFLAFGWPILLSAVPLLAVYQGDRVIVARFFDMEELGGYSAAFVITMVPISLATKVGLSLGLPILANVQNDRDMFAARYRTMTELGVAAAALYLAVFAILGGHMLPLVFGPNFSGYGTLVATLAVMWSIRMLQVAPGAALMACGQTRPHLVAGMLRATSLGLAVLFALNGGSLAVVAAAGIVGELLSLASVAVYMRRIDPALARLLNSRAIFHVGVVAAVCAVYRLLPLDGGVMWAGVVAMSGCALVVGSAALLFAETRNQFLASLSAQATEA